MKRLLSSVIILSVLFSCTVFATDNAIFTEGFENGFNKNIVSDSKQKVEIVETCASAGRYCAHITKRTSPELALKVNLTDFIKKGTYKFSVDIRLDDEAFDFANFYAGIRIKTDKGTTEFKTESVEIVNERFTCCEAETIISWDGELVEAVFFIANKIKAEQNDVFVDEIRIERIAEKLNEPNDIKFSSLTVGAIKRDIWQNGNPEAEEVIKKLSVIRYNRYLPYYYDLGTKNFESVSFSVAEDLKYAEYMGIDFFAYYISDSKDTVKLHSQSATKIKFCLVIDKNTEISQIKNYISNSKYLSVDGKPIVFILDSVASSIAQIKSEASSLGKEVLIGVIGSNASQGEFTDLVAVKGDKDNFSFAKEKSLWSDSQSNNVIPIVTAFDGEGKNKEEIKRHITDGISVAKNKTNCMLIDSWNFYEDFTNIAPSYKADSKGNLFYNNGKYVLNTELADFLNSTLGGNKNIAIKRETGTAPSTTPNVTNTAETAETPAGNIYESTSTPNLSATPTTTPELTPNSNNDVEMINEPNKFVIGLVVSVVVISVASVVKILMEKRKKNGKKG